MQSGPQDVYVTVDWNMLPDEPMTRRYVPSSPSADALPANPMAAPETTTAVTSVLLMVCMAPPLIPPPRLAANTCCTKRSPRAEAFPLSSFSLSAAGHQVMAPAQRLADRAAETTVSRPASCGSYDAQWRPCGSRCWERVPWAPAWRSHCCARTSM